MNRTTPIAAAALTALLMSSPDAQAIPMEWSLQGMTFDDGGTAEGSFVYDYETGVLWDWIIVVSGGNSNIWAPFTYSKELTLAREGTRDSVEQAQGLVPALMFTTEFASLNPTPPPGAGPFRELRISPADALDGSATNVDLLVTLGAVGVGSEECWGCNPFRSLVAGSFSFVTIRYDFPIHVPEPGPLPLLGVGIAAAVACRRRSRPRSR
jgi:hypothetical protein